MLFHLCHLAVITLMTLNELYKSWSYSIMSFFSVSQGVHFSIFSFQIVIQCPQWSWTQLLDPRFAGSNPAEDDGFLRVIKVCSMTSFGGEVKPLVPCFDLWHVKEPYENERYAL
jgi:hypothetical protein